MRACAVDTKKKSLAANAFGVKFSVNFAVSRTNFQNLAMPRCDPSVQDSNRLIRAWISVEGGREMDAMTSTGKCSHQPSAIVRANTLFRTFQMS